MNTSVREGGAPNQVSTAGVALEPDVGEHGEPAVRRSAGSGPAACPATLNAASTAAFSPVTVATCTTQGQGLGGSATGSFLLKAPLRRW